MTLDADACYRALLARDVRFDGAFFVAVKTTHIYCRPICRARTPGRDRCLFYRRAAEAERDGFRACLLCRPERAPGAALYDAPSRAVTAALARIDEGALNEAGVDDLAEELGLTGRHLRRAMQAEIGLSPLALAQSRRLALARELLHGTSLSVTEIAFASGFSSLRRFNDAFRALHRMPPSSMRRRMEAAALDEVELTLDYRPPYDWDAMIAFFRARAVRGVEAVTDGVYRRTVALEKKRGVITVSPAESRAALLVRVPLTLTSVLMPLAARVRRLFDLDATPTVIRDHLERDRRLRRLVGQRPGLRVPGAFDRFEIATRAVLGQQVSVAAAATLASRLADRFGEALRDDRHPDLVRVWPSAERIASAGEHDLAAIGLTKARAGTLRSLASAVASGRLRLDAWSDPDTAVAALAELPGIGPWTAQYVAMRALGWPDAFPEGDLGIRKALGALSPAACRELAEPWRPWRAYAALHLWASLA